MDSIVNFLNGIAEGLIRFIQGLGDGFTNLVVGQKNIIECSTNSTCSVIHGVVFAGLLFFVLLTGFAYTTLLERKLLAFFQQRVGPNRAGPGAFFQPVADGLKLIFKEDVTPVGADKWVYILAPIMKTVPSILVVACIPVGPPLLIPWFDGNWYRVGMSLGDVNVGVLYILAWLSLGTYGIVLAGWSSNNKYSMLGGLRASAQMLSYELSLGLSMAVPIIITGSMAIGTIIAAQGGTPVLSWFVFQNPVSAGILLIALLAEVNRAPFDLPEAESELTAGYHTEYSGMKFALFFMAEYISMISVSMIAIALFFGGYHFFLVDQVPILGPIVFFVKVVLFLCAQIWVRATLPRIRYDRLMTFGWKVLVPLALVSVAWTSTALIIGDTFESPTLYFAISIVSFLVVSVFAFAALRPKLDVIPTGLENVEIQQRGPGYILLNVVGGLLSVPFVLFGLTGRLLGAGKSDTKATR